MEAIATFAIKSLFSHSHILIDLLVSHLKHISDVAEKDADFVSHVSNLNDIKADLKVLEKSFLKDIQDF